MKRLVKIIRKNIKLVRGFTPARWRYLLYNLSQREKKTIAVALTIAALASFFLAGWDYWALRQPSPARGGEYTEGIVGEPRYLNPVLSATNETDRDITPLLFSGLTRHDENGNIVGDLAESVEVKEKGRVYEFRLKEGLIWPDGTPLTADDVIFTIDLIQSPEYQSPVRATWQGVRAEKIDSRNIRFSLNLPYQPFLENTTLGILPKHFWINIKPQNFALAELNIKPVGAGPYVIRKIAKDTTGSIKSLELKRNKNYHNEVFIDKITLKFYQNEDNLLSAWRKRDIDALSLFSAKTKDQIKGRDTVLYKIQIPRYFAVFFNDQNSELLKEDRVRQALDYATPREQIITDILEGEATLQDGPLPPWMLNKDVEYFRSEFNKELAKETLDKAGWRENEETGLREKKDKTLVFTLTTTDWPELTQVATMLQENWESVGFKVNLDIIPVNDIQQQIIRPRQYEALLFGEVLGTNPDPFSFWHSSQTQELGLNLSLYENKTVDSLLESARQELDEIERQEKFNELQQIITRDNPAIFLYSPNYLYVLPKKIKGFVTSILSSPSQRFETINTWYINTKRTRK